MLKLSTIDKIFNTSINAWLKDFNGSFLAATDTQAMQAGLMKGEELIGVNDLDLCWKKQAPVYLKNDLSVLSLKKAVFRIEPCTCFDNRKILVFSYKTPIYSDTGKIISVLGISFKEEQLKNQKNFLTNRERDCLIHYVKGMTAAEIAKKLNLSPRTIEQIISAIKGKLNCHTRAEVFSIAMNMDEVIASLIDRWI